MQTWPEMMNALDTPQIEQLMGYGREQTVEAGGVLVQEGTDMDTMSFLIQGLLCVSRAQAGASFLATLGPGDVVGEMSFLESQTASASVVAAERSQLWSIDHATLKNLLGRDPNLAARLYCVLARTMGRRLRDTMDQWSCSNPTTENDTSSPLMQHCREALEPILKALKSTARSIDEANRSKDASALKRHETSLLETFAQLSQALGEHLHPESPLTASERNLAARWVREEVLPFIKLTQLGNRLYTKPRGHAGDYVTLRAIMTSEVGGQGRIGPVLDQAILAEPGCRTIQERPRLLAQRIMDSIAKSQSKPTRVTALGCGPAAEVFAVYDQLPDPKRLFCTLIDVDVKALSWIADEAQARGLSDHIRLVPENVAYLAMGQRPLDLEPQDLVYSSNLLESFDDRTAIRAINYAHRLTRANGQVVFGHLHPCNPSRALFELVFEWVVEHRSDTQLQRLFADSVFGTPCALYTHADGVGRLASAQR